MTSQQTGHCKKQRTLRETVLIKISSAIIGMLKKYSKKCVFSLPPNYSVYCYIKFIVLFTYYIKPINLKEKRICNKIGSKIIFLITTMLFNQVTGEFNETNLFLLCLPCWDQFFHCKSNKKKKKPYKFKRLN